MKKIFISILGLSLITSCDTRTYEDISPAVPTTVTYNNNVKPIMTASCTSCHSTAGGEMPFLENYTQVKNNITTVLSTMNNGTMPPAGALPSTTIQVIQNWKNAGMPE